MTDTIKPCITAIISTPQIPPISLGLPNASVTLPGISVPPGDLICCQFKIPVPVITIPNVLPAQQVAIAVAAINALLKSSYTILAQINIPKCKL